MLMIPPPPPPLIDTDFSDKITIAYISRIIKSQYPEMKKNEVFLEKY